ncbi:MAG: SUMF1/EgtB/PvdO family nonheme iron enzyme [Tannerellaceae bacterium]|nr:SUMF1/EgtB/PvdO family nonheme iron enzyme [Tannerellaceae bacterium]
MKITLIKQNIRKPVTGFFLYIFLLGMALLGSCSQDEGIPADENNPVEVRFTSGSDAVLSPGTRTTNDGNEWLDTDTVGIFMVYAGQELSVTGIADQADNIKYTVRPGIPASQADLFPADPEEIICYPHSGRSVDFIAYYPYGYKGSGIGRLTDDYLYPVSLLEQSTPEAQAKVDLLYSNNAVNQEISNGPVRLEFEHALSKIIINVTRTQGQGTDEIDLSTLLVSAYGVYTEADFSLKDGLFMNYRNKNSNGNLLYFLKSEVSNSDFGRVEALLFPGSDLTATFRFTISHGTYSRTNFTWTIPGDFVLVPGQTHTFNIGLSERGVTFHGVDVGEWDTTGNTVPGTAESIPVETVQIPAGVFTMGSPDSETGRNTDETSHQVTLTESFYMSKYPVTNAQYADFLNSKGIGSNGRGNVAYNENGSIITQEQLFIEGSLQGVRWDSNEWIPVSGFENYPVTMVSWYGAKAYADWTGGSLPTEAQWEYACRAGEPGAYSYGSTANGDYMWYSGNTSALQEVGTKYPNPWNLHDMHGNVYEWCADWYKADFGSNNAGDPVINPSGPVSGTNRVLRGGSWNTPAGECRSANRNQAIPSSTSTSNGFRVVFVL